RAEIVTGLALQPGDDVRVQALALSPRLDRHASMQFGRQAYREGARKWSLGFLPARGAELPLPVLVLMCRATSNRARFLTGMLPPHRCLAGQVALHVYGAPSLLPAPPNWPRSCLPGCSP